MNQDVGGYIWGQAGTAEIKIALARGVPQRWRG